MTLSGP